MKYFCIFIAIFFFSLTGCKEDSDNGTDPGKARETVNEANAALESVLYQLINGDINEPKDVNLQEPYNLFNTAYKQDPNNPDANFGLALTNLLMITQNEELDKVFKDWDAFFEEDNDGLGKNAASHKLDFPKSFKSFIFPKKALVQRCITLPKSALLDPPKFNDIQRVIEGQLIPRLEFAINALDRVDDHEDYVFMVSPKMQGDINADSVEIDLTEIYALEVAVNSLHTLANLTIAYNVDFWGFDSTEAIIAFSKGGSFLRLRSGATPMNKTKASILNTLNKIEAGITFLRNEKDPQDDDLIKLDKNADEDLDKILDEIDNVRVFLNKPKEYTDDWDNDQFTPEEALTINFGKLFDNPIDDMKAKLPDYSISVRGEEITNEFNWVSGQKFINTQISVPSAGYYYYSRSYSWESEGEFEYNYFSSNVEIARFNQVFDSLTLEFKNKQNLSRLNLYLYWGKNLTAGTHEISSFITFDSYRIHTLLLLYIPTLTWTANSFSSWIFPDPTFNDFLPGMTDSEFKRIFGITADDWEKNP